MKAFDDIAALLVTITMVALVAVIVSKKSKSPGVIRSFFSGFAKSINAAQN